MRKIVKVDELAYDRVDWGLTKNLIGPQTTESKHIKVNITEYLPGYIHQPHIHPHQEEVIYVLSGRGISESQEGKVEIGPGSVVFIPAGVNHATWNLSNTESLKTIIIKSPPDDEEVRI